MFLLYVIRSIDVISSLTRSMSDTRRGEQCSDLVPYVKPVILREFSSDHRAVTINMRKFQLHQDWQQNGIAGVIWDSV